MGSVSAVAVDNGIFDYTALVRKPKPENHSIICDIHDGPTRGLQIQQFLRIQTFIEAQFRAPVHCWEPFASPALYFRSAPVNIPSNFISQHELKPIHNMQDFVPVPESPRHRIQFPPVDSTLDIPRIRISCCEGGILDQQSEEMAKLLRESIISYSGALNPRTEAQRRIEVVKRVSTRDKRKYIESNSRRNEGIVEWLMAALK